MRDAPRNASRASSASVRTCGLSPVDSSIERTRSSRFGAWRIAAVATILMSCAPSSRAWRTCVATTSVSAAIACGGIAPLLRITLPSRV